MSWAVIGWSDRCLGMGVLRPTLLGNTDREPLWSYLHGTTFSELGKKDIIPYSIGRYIYRVVELTQFLVSQPVGDRSYKTGGRLPLVFARPALTSQRRASPPLDTARWSTELLSVDDCPGSIPESAQLRVHSHVTVSDPKPTFEGHRNELLTPPPRYPQPKLVHLLRN